MNDLLFLLAEALKAFQIFEFVDTFENRKEIWFNWNDGKTYKLILLAVE